MNKAAKILKYTKTNECPLTPDFWRILAFDGSHLWCHYKRLSMSIIFEAYRLSPGTTVEGVSDGQFDGAQIRLSESEFRGVSDRIHDEKFRYWNL